MVRKLARLVAVAISFNAATQAQEWDTLSSNSWFQQNINKILLDEQLEQADNKPSNPSAFSTACASVVTPDALSANIVRALAYHGDTQCALYSPERYRQFQAAVPEDQRTVTNYVHWIGGKPLLDAAAAAESDRQLLAQIDAATGGAGLAAAPSAPVDVAAVETERARLEAAPTYRPGASEFADGGKLGACGVPYLDQAMKDEQAFVASEGACDEYVAEVEAEGY